MSMTILRNSGLRGKFQAQHCRLKPSTGRSVNPTGCTKVWVAPWNWRTPRDEEAMECQMQRQFLYRLSRIRTASRPSALGIAARRPLWAAPCRTRGPRQRLQRAKFHVSRTASLSGTSGLWRETRTSARWKFKPRPRNCQMHRCLAWPLPQAPQMSLSRSRARQRRRSRTLRRLHLGQHRGHQCAPWRRLLSWAAPPGWTRMP
mmetsp:Transcript_99849/g.286829  ORF Transcript_99849/g.286829 Transcript_99849/m.286829 type:complete len:203 (-) Transcript_99849:1202-1810(-)